MSWVHYLLALYTAKGIEWSTVGYEGYSRLGYSRLSREGGYSAETK
jgi:hypothetical protein